MVRADGPRPLAPGCHSPVMGRRDGPWGTRAAMGRKAGGRACLLWVLWMDRRVSCVSIVFCGSKSSVHAVACGLCLSHGSAHCRGVCASCKLAALDASVHILVYRYY